MEKKEFMNELRNQLEKNKITSSYSGEKETESNDPNQKLNLQDWKEYSYYIRKIKPDEVDFYDDDGYDLVDNSGYDYLFEDDYFDDLDDESDDFNYSEYSDESLECQKRRDEIVFKLDVDSVKEDLSILKGIIETKTYNSHDELINDLIKIRDYISGNVINVLIEEGKK